MINVDGKTYRNLEEQVRKNQEDIHSLKFGLNIVGRVADYPLLPENAKIGDAFLVGSHEPFNIYVKIGDPKDYINMGTLASTVEGPKGDTGTVGPTGNGIYFIELAEPNCNLIVHYTNGETEELGSIKGDQGKQGLPGPRGMRGEEGPKGDKGEKGDTGTTFKLIGELSSTGALPTPPSNPTNAYLVTGTNPGLYVWVGNTWKNQGPIAQTSVIYGETVGTSYEGSAGKQLENKINATDKKSNEMIEQISGTWNNQYTLIQGGYIDYTDGTINSTSNGYKTDYIPVNMAKGFYLKGVYLGGAGALIAYYDINKNYLKDISVQGTDQYRSINVDLTDPKYSKVAYIRCSSYGDDSVNAKLTLFPLINLQDSSSANFIDRESLRSDVYLINIKGRINEDGEIRPTSGFRSDKIYLKDVDTIYYEGQMGGENPILCFFDKNDVIIKTLTIKANPNIHEGHATKAFDMRDPKYKDANYAIASAYLDVLGNSSAGFKNSKVIIKRIADRTNISPLKDAKVLIFGDSITTNADIQDSQDKTTYYATSPFSHSWSTYLLEYEGIKHYRNYAKAGASYGNQPGKENDRLSLTHQVKLAINDSTNPNNVFEEAEFTPDIIIFALGVNDTNFKDDSYEMAMSKTVYKPDGETIDVEATLNNLDLNKMYQAARWCYLKVKQKWPFSQMFIVSPIQSLDNDRQTNNEGTKYDNLKKLARRYGAVFIDGFSNGIIKEFQEIYLHDGLHPQSQGYKVMARQIIAALNANYIDYNNILNKLQN